MAALWALPATSAQAAPASCAFPNSQYKHVIEVQFDNTHLTRDRPSVPSDLEQIPALKNFLAGNGTLLGNDHTVLISHTAGGIVSTLTGLYPDRNGINVSNSYQYYTGSPTSTNFASAFSYWTDPVGFGDPLPNMVTTGGVNTPAPWVPFTRAGCDFGAVATANIELENTKTNASGDITKVFGGGVSGLSSPQAAIALNDKPVATTDFEGIAIHCAQASPRCTPANGGVPDQLPAEPGGYNGFNGLFGALYANQVLSQPGRFTPATTDANSPTYNSKVVPSIAPPVLDVYDYTASPGLNNPATQVIGPAPGQSGFPGFDPTAAQSLGYVAAMQEAGVPVTFAYIADAHDNHTADAAYGPGQQGYVNQLRDYNTAFKAFFDRLAKDGIDKSNTLFVFTVDEGDHFAGGPPTNPACDGVTTPCNYTPGSVGPNTIGEQDVDLVNALAQEKGNTTPFDLHADSAPTVYVHGAPAPGPSDPKVRQLERDTAGLTLTNARTGATDQVTQHIADQADQSILHMVNADPARTPSFTLFGNPDYFFQQEGPFGYTCADPHGPPGCPVVNPGFAWNHGDDNPEIARTWVGYVGPTVRNLGATNATWTDHTDLRPTILAALGLSDSYAPDGRVVSEILDPAALPAGLGATTELGAAYKQLNAPFGSFGHDSEVASTTAVKTQSPGDAVYRAWDAQLQTCGTLRDALAGQIRSALQGAEFNGHPLAAGRATELTVRSALLIGQMHTLSLRSTPPTQSACAPISSTTSLTEVSCSPDPIPVGTPAKCTATLTDTAGGTPTGTITFARNSSGGFSAASCALVGVGTGQASCSVSYTPAAVDSGSHRIYAAYSGDRTASTGFADIAVTGGPPRPSATSVACAPAAVAAGKPTTCTATVADTGAYTKTTPTGTVSFGRNSSGAFSAATCNLAPSGAGRATCAVQYTPSARQSGLHKVYADYTGDHAASAGSTTVGVS